jgi:hypothetical protein
MKTLIFTIFISISFGFINVTVNSQDNKGIINGIVKDKETQSPVNDAIIEILELQKKTAADASGNFEFKDIPYGTYQLKVSSLGYETVVKTDIVVLSSRPANVTAELLLSNITTAEIDVEGKYFQKSTDESTSNYNLDFEEIRRSPGAVEDISRMVQTLPGISPANDQRNDLIVRGGSPAENLTMIDGIEIPNVNHYPTQGSTSGPIGMINVKFINNVDFSTGGFSARYGDKLSSVMHISFREGYRKKFLCDINLSTAGFGGVFEGPLFTKKGSFMFSVRKSYLNLIRGAIRLAAVPDYWDFNLKTVYDFNKNNKLTFVGVGGLDKISFEGEASEISDDNPYGKAKGDQKQFTAGFNLKSLFKKGYVQTVIANSTAYTNIENRDLRTDAMKFYYDSFESDYNVKSELFYQINSTNNIIFGGGARYIKFRYNNYFYSDTTSFGYIIPEINVNRKDNFYKGSAFAQYTLKLLGNNLIMNAGLRYDYFSGIKEKNAVSPRFGISYSILPTTTISASSGIYYQSPEYIWLMSDVRNENLKFMKANHYVLGIEHLFTADLRLSVEGYHKDYNNYPVSVLAPTYVLISGGTENGPNLLLCEAVSKGFGYSRGIDVSLHKKLTGSGFYGMLNYSLAESRITGLEGGEKPGSFDYRHNITVIAGYQLANDWLVGLKFRYTTGRPYTPINAELSIIAGREVSDFAKFNMSRYKDYNRLDLRVDKKWNFKKLSIVSYIELQNVFNTENVYQYFWNEYKNEQSTIYQWAFLPVGGFSIQF